MKLKQSDKKSQTLLPLLSKVVFVDWHGVLSDTPFWHSMRHKRLGPGFNFAEKISEELFVNRADLVADWMRGKASSDDVVTAMRNGLSQEGQVIEIDLLEKLKRDCKFMNYDRGLLGKLQTIRSSAYLTLATDNMDCFVEALPKRPSLYRHFDFVLSSSELGVLKKESVETFFGDWLHAHGLSYSQALLIDDRNDNCDAFRSAGGHATVYSGWESIRRDLTLFLNLD